MKENFGKEIENLEYTLKRECEMRALLEWKRLHLTKQMEFLATTDESFLNETNKKLEAGKKRQTELIMKNKKAEKELLRTEERIKNLGEVADKKEAEYKDYKERVIESIKVLEDEIETVMESLNQKEQQLSLRRPVAEETQRELEEKHAKYEELRKKVSDLKDEEANLTKFIERSLRATRRLQKTMVMVIILLDVVV
ncbi:PREDICTED: myosin-8-like [Gavialis gangeticus]|uniref:myosin-8-like n=1 Tax=Gavialis gangeticus TaxID=94835 RepID=UPI00092F8F24|nr:PREDICTED: myosin-8-like [Gavialis gangeticus]